MRLISCLGKTVGEIVEFLASGKNFGQHQTIWKSWDDKIRSEQNSLAKCQTQIG